MRPRELDIAIEWAAAEQWNPGLHDATPFFAADPAGYFLGLLDGDHIASISAVAYDSTFGFLGFYIVRPEFRSNGYGIALWQHAMAHLGTRNAGLDAVPEQESNYERSGFRTAYRTIRYHGVPTTSGLAGPPSVIDLRSLPFEQVAAFDRRFFPASRDAFLRAWLSIPGSHVLGMIADGSLIGYGVVRPCRIGFKVGPLFADSASTAETILDALITHLPPATPLTLDVPQPNLEGLRLAERRGLLPMAELARMYTQTPPSLPLDGIFGVTSLELG